MNEIERKGLLRRLWEKRDDIIIASLLFLSLLIISSAAIKGLLELTQKKVEPYEEWICDEYAYQGDYWVSCKKYVCVKLRGVKYCKYLEEELKMRRMG